MTTPKTPRVFPPIPTTSDPADRERLIGAVVEQVFSTTNMRIKSVLTPKQMVHLVRLGVYGEYFSSPTAKFIYQALLETVVSTDQKGGRGRRDLTEVLKAIISQNEQPIDKNRSIMQRLFR